MSRFTTAIALGFVAATIAGRAAASLTVSTDSDCGPHEYAVGVSGRTGLWIDAVGAVCARWDERTFQTFPGRRPRPVGGSGGGPVQKSCPAGSAISGWKVESVIQNDAAFADRLTLECRMLAPPHDVTATGLVFGGSNQLRRGASPRVGRCPEGQLATGVSVWASSDGRFVTDAKMQCERAPAGYSSMSWQSGANGAVTYFSPELKVRSGDSVRLDWCREWATNCGAPAAEAFCKAKGMARAVSFAAKPNAGLTVIISDKRICNAPGCTAFTSITCGPAQG